MDTPISIGARLTQLAAERPDRPAVSDDHRTVTWRELDRRTNRIARGLEAAGVIAHAKSRIGSVKAPKSVEFVEAIPKTPNGKMDKKPLRTLYWGENARMVN